MARNLSPQSPPTPPPLNGLQTHRLAARTLGTRGIASQFGGAPPSPPPLGAPRRALRKQKKARKNLEDEKSIHDLRVALRRCRSLAEDFSALDVHPVWRHLAKECQKQQRGLNDLRDVQVMAGWVRRLRLDGNSSDGFLAAALKKDERRARHHAAKSLENFPRKRWKEWLHSLPERAELIPVGESRLVALAIDRLADGHELERHWRETHDAAAWHKLRVAMK